MFENMPEILQNPYIIILAALWSIIWKGFALWKAASLKKVGWFIALLVINTLGILEIIYLTIVTKADVQQEIKKPGPSGAE